MEAHRDVGGGNLRGREQDCSLALKQSLIDYICTCSCKIRTDKVELRSVNVL